MTTMIYIILSTIVFAFLALVWRRDDTINKVIQIGFILMFIGGLATLLINFK